MKKKLSLVVLACVLWNGAAAAGSESGPWKPAGDRLQSRWAGKVDPGRVLPEYPRPQMVRQDWGNLNGLWDYAITPREAGKPEAYAGKILVPFAVESSLSGVGKTVGAANYLWYRTAFRLPDAWRSEKRILLHFGAVDWECAVWVNGKEVGSHRGGYDPFTLEITDAVVDGPEQELVVRVWDPTDEHFQPRGKQVREPRGIWYTSVSGIWQTVWIEPVPKVSIASLRMTPDIDNDLLRLRVETRGGDSYYQVKVQARDGTRIAGENLGRAGKELQIRIPEARRWSPDDPFLYGLKVTLYDGTGPVDTVNGYFGMRKVSFARDKHGFNRILLNNEPLFHFGPLDQGWWPDGLYTAPSDEALRHDVKTTKGLGFNMARKHVKVEPARWYYHCDRAGLMVWQDFPSGDKYIKPDEPDIQRSDESAANFDREYKAMIDAFYNHPSIVVWVPFNEGWGQFDTDRVLAWTKEYDPSRLVDGPSGWSDRGTGDIHDLHRYPGPAMPEPEENRVIVLGEFGGLGWPVEGHLWWNKRNWGYRTYTSQEELVSNYLRLIDKLVPLIGKGLAGAIYTQTSDVEGEVNGLMTYDRAVVKLSSGKVRSANLRVYEPPKVYETRVVLPSSREKAQRWKYSVTRPEAEWFQSGYDDSSWKEGSGGFGTEDTPGAVVGTEWSNDGIWLRRRFKLDDGTLSQPRFLVHHDEEAFVYLNGKRVQQFVGYTGDYEEVDLTPAAREALRPGENVIAVYCRQSTGGQFIDIGIIDLVEKK